MAWTDEMVEELKKLWAEGVTTGEIGRRLNISKNSIVGKVHRLGLSGRPSPIKKKSDEIKTEKPAAPKTAVKEKSIKKIPTVKKPVKEPVKQEAEAEKKIESKPAAAISAPVYKPAAAPALSTNEEDDIKLASSINPLFPDKHKKGHVSLTELDNHTCRWPIGDPKDDNFHFCGKKVRLGQTYCEEHSAIAYIKPGKK